MSSIGEIPEPPDFRYRKIFLKGKPEHDRTDAFRCRHPKMDVGRRAKIFAPFDALRGFNEAVASKDVLYEERREPDEGELDELNRRLDILRRAAGSARTGDMNQTDGDVPADDTNRIADGDVPADDTEPLTIAVTYFVPCSDPNSEFFGSRGRYVTRTGLFRGVDADVRHILFVDDLAIRFEDILSIRLETGLFLRDTE